MSPRERIRKKVPSSRRTALDFQGYILFFLARSAGIGRVYSCDTGEEWRGTAAEALSGPGPVVVWLTVAPRVGERAPTAMRPMREQLARLRQALEMERPASGH